MAVASLKMIQYCGKYAFPDLCDFPYKVENIDDMTQEDLIPIHPASGAMRGYFASEFILPMKFIWMRLLTTA